MSYHELVAGDGAGAGADDRDCGAILRGLIDLCSNEDIK